LRFTFAVNDHTKANTQPKKVQPKKIFKISIGTELLCTLLIAIIVGRKYTNKLNTKPASIKRLEL
jgi:hypothetical protein